jgi:hypothetical protein
VDCRAEQVSVGGGGGKMKSPMAASGLGPLKHGVQVYGIGPNVEGLQGLFDLELIEGGWRGWRDDDALLICQQALLPSMDKRITAGRQNTRSNPTSCDWVWLAISEVRNRASLED